MTLHERIAETSMEDYVGRDPAWLSFLYGFGKELAEGRWSDGYADVIGEGCPGRRLPLHQVHAMVMVNSFIHDGDVMVARIHVGTTPGPDKAIKDNNRKLKHLPRPFRAFFSPGPRKDGDGVLSWDEPVVFDPIACRGDETGPCEASAKQAVVIARGAVPLEVGSTRPSRTYMHLLERSFAVARWPYGSEFVFVLHRTPQSTRELWQFVLGRLTRPRTATPAGTRP